jgi:WD40 repeat protein
VIGQPGSARDLVFVSYSHADAAWLRRLGVIFKGYEMRGRLQVWADPYIQVGERWERAIDAALARARVGVLLTSTSFLASEFIYRVELPALVSSAQRNDLRLFCVPVSAADTDLLTDLLQYQWPRPPGQPLDLLDEPQRNQAMVELVKALVTLFGSPTLGAVASLLPPSTPAAAVLPLHAQADAGLAALQGVPELPPHFVPRAAAIDELRSALLDGSEQRFGVTAGGAAGLYGQGGIGKSVLAAAACHDETVRRALAGGVYWLTLGQQPSPIALQQELWRMLTGERVDFPSAAAGADRLRARLRDEACLLVLDDAWHAEHIQALDVVGPRGRMLVTTRDRRLLAGVEARVLSLDVLAPDDARDLLARWAGQAAASLPPEASAVARECGFLPLALALAGAQIRDGASWGEVAAALAAGDLEFLDHPHGSIFKSLGASVRALPPDEQERYRELAVFPEDTPVPEHVVAWLWGAADLSEARARKLLRSFASRALLTLVDEKGGGPGKLVTFHDLQGDYLRLVVGDLPAAHARLLAACYRALPGDAPGPARWSSLPGEERYLWSHLLHHLAQAGDAAGAQALVTDVRWLEAKAAASGVSLLLTDLAALAEGVPTLEIRRIERALRLEGGWLQHDARALPGLLYNRLRASGLDAAAIQALAPGLRPAVRLRHPVRMGGAEHRIFRGHTSQVMACAYSSDCARILSASADGTLREWARETGHELRCLVGHAGSVNACVYSADGRRVLSASDDGTLREWDRESGRELRRFEGHGAALSSCAYSPDGTRVLSGSWDETIREWDRESGRELRRLLGDCGHVSACAYSSDGRHILSASGVGSLREWDAESGALLRKLVGHTGYVTCCAYSPDGARILSSSWDWTVREWDRESGRELRRFEGHAGYVTGCAYSPDGTRVLSASYDRTVREWDRETGRELHRFEGHAAYINACVYSPDGARILSGSWDRTLREWGRDRADEVLEVDRHEGSVNACVFSADGTRLLSASRDWTVREWDVATGREVRRFVGHAGSANACAYSPDGTRVLSASVDRSIREWDRETGVELRRIDKHNQSVSACAYSPDGRRILSASRDETLRVWDRETGRELRRFDKHASSLSACAYSGDGRRALSSSADGTLREWDIEGGRDLCCFDGHRAQVTAGVYAEGDRRVLSSSADGTVREWEVPSQSELGRFEGHTGWVQECAYAPDGAHVLSVSDDATIKIWDRATRRCLYTFYGTAPFYCLAVSDGRLAAGDELGNVWILDCDLF